MMQTTWILAATGVFLLSTILPSDALSCYSYSEYLEELKVLEKMQYCIAMYEVGHNGTFTGHNDNSKREHLKWDIGRHKDCQLHNHNLPGYNEKTRIYTCVCFSSLCNFPFTWEEFSFRGHTLKPVYPDVEDIF